MFGEMFQALYVGKSFKAHGKDWLCVGYVKAVEGGSLLLGVDLDGNLPAQVQAVVALHSENKSEQKENA